MIYTNYFLASVAQAYETGVIKKDSTSNISVSYGSHYPVHTMRATTEQSTTPSLLIFLRSVIYEDLFSNTGDGKRTPNPGRFHFP